MILQNHDESPTFHNTKPRASYNRSEQNFDLMGHTSVW
jgi:hypothetical protein